MYKLNIHLSAIIAAFTLAFQISPAAVLNVPDDYETIQEGIDHAEEGDTVLVQPGEYVENINFNGKNISVIGNPDNPEEVIIDGDENGSVVTFENGEGENAVLVGFTIRNGFATSGAGISLRESNPSLANLIITGNVAEGQEGYSGLGGGIFCFNANPTMTSLVISDNRAVRAGGGIGSIYSEYTIYYSCFFENHAAIKGGAIYLDNSDPTLVNLTLSNNSAEEIDCGGIYCYNYSDPSVINCVLWNNGEKEIEFWQNAGPNSVSISFTDIQGGRWGGIETNENGEVEYRDNIDEEPLFVDPDNGDFHLTADSPCIDAGDENSPDDPDNTYVDMGAYFFDQRDENEIGFLDVPGAAVDIVVSGNYAYITDQHYGLRIIDISNPREPEEIGGVETGQADGIFVSGEYAYVSNYHGGLSIIDISDPENAEIIGRQDTPGTGSDVFVLGDYAYVADYLGGLRIIDVSNPRDPEETGFYAPRWFIARAVYVSGNYAYLAANLGEGLHIFDVSYPENPEEIGSYEIDEREESIFTEIWVSNEIAYLTAVELNRRIGRLEIIDVSNPQNPERIGGHQLGEDNTFVNVKVYGDYSYVIARRDDLMILDISNPRGPRQVGSYQTPDIGMGIAIDRFYAYIASFRSGLRIIDISDVVGEQPYINIQRLTLEFGNVYISNHENLLIDISNQGNADLVISDVVVEGEAFSANFEGEITIESEDSHELTVTFAPEEIGEFEGSLTIFSNDPANGEVVVPLTGIGILAELTIPFTEGWNLISLNIDPAEEYYAENDDRGPDAELMMEQLRIAEDSHHVIIMKDEIGRFYLPDWDYNDIPFWDLEEGYMVKVDEDVDAAWEGEAIPADRELWLDEGWNYIPYYPTYELPADAPEFYVLSPIIDHVWLAKNIEGFFMIPDWDYSNMPPWRETQGYQVKVDEDVILNYPEELEDRAFAFNTPPLNPPLLRSGGVSANPPLLRSGGGSARYFPAGESKGGASRPHWTYPNPTGENMSLLIVESAAFIQNCQIAALSPDGRLVGAGTVDKDGRCGLAVWGDDLSTDAVEGLRAGEGFELRGWDSDRQAEVGLSVTAVRSGQGLVYQTDSWIVVETCLQPEIPDEIYLVSDRKASLCHSSAGWNPDGGLLTHCKNWIPACAGMTDGGLNSIRNRFSVRHYLGSNYPNPFNSITRIDFGLNETMMVSIGVYNINGQFVESLKSSEMKAGRHWVAWNAEVSPTGVYVVRMKTGQREFTRKIILLR